MPTKVLRKPKKKYPYDIAPVDPPDMEIIKSIRPNALWEFLRVMALSRSEEVQELYRQGKRKGAPLLRQRFDFDWALFTEPLNFWTKGTEVYDPKDIIMWDFGETGILDLAKLKKEFPDLWNSGDWLNKAVFHATFPLLAVTFDRFVPTETIIENLRPLLQKRDMSQPEGEKWRTRQVRYFDPTVLKTYLDYLRSYDLYHDQQLDPREIGRCIYPKHKNPTDMARTAVKRAKMIIQQAEKREWPPKI